MPQINFALAGCGRIAQRHAKHIKHFGQLLAVCDTDFSKATKLASEYGATPYPSLEEMLSNVSGLDVVCICTPNGLHATHTIYSLEMGNHVICEKPMAISVKDCQEMIRMAEKMQKQLFVVKQNRFNPPIIALKEIVQEKRLGKIFSAQLNCFWNRNDNYYLSSDWKGNKSLDGGTLFTQFSHFIDLLYWIIGEVKEVNGFIGNFNHQNFVQFEDCGVINLLFENGCLGSIHYTVNSYEKNMEGSITLFGEKGTVKVGGQYLNELEYQAIENYLIEDLPMGNPPNHYGQYIGSMSNHDQVYKNVIDVLTGNGEIATTGRDGLKTVEIIEMIYKNVKEVSPDKF